MKPVSKLLALCALTWSLWQAQAAIDLTGYGPQPADRTKPTIEAWIDNLVTTYNALNPVDLPDPGNRLFRVNSGDTTAPAAFPTFDGGLSITLPAGYYEYFVLHWRGPNGGFSQAFYIGNDSGGLNFDSPWQLNLAGTQLKQYDLSWYAGFDLVTAVPEPSTVLAGLFALVPMGLTAFRATRNRQS